MYIVEPRQVASVAVISGTKILMGKRRDNGKWTLPGGGVEQGETPEQGAIRELYEEAGIRAHSLACIGETTIVKPSGELMTIHAFQMTCEPETTVENDPDKEVNEWVWVETFGGLPRAVASNLQSKRNVVLECLGLSKSLLEPELIIKAQKPHKYLRKYKSPSGKMVYVYNEKGQRGRRMTAEQMDISRRLAELGDEQHRRLQESMVKMDPEKLDILNRLADLGDESAKKALVKMGVDYDTERVERKLMAERREREARAREAAKQNELLKDLEGDRLKSAHDAIRAGLKDRVFGYLRGHTESPYYRSLVDQGVSLDSVMDEIEKKKSVKDMMVELDRQMKKVDEAHRGLPETRNSLVRDAGSYGNLGYSAALDGLVGSTHLPPRSSSSRIFERGLPNATNGDWKRAGDMIANAVRSERERKEKEEREQKAAFEIHAESVEAMSSYFGRTISEAEKKKLAGNIQNFFGADFKFERFYQHLQGKSDVEIKISESFLDGLMSGRKELGVSFKIQNRDGQTITSASRSIIKEDSGAITWMNSVFNRPSNRDLDNYPGMATGLYGGVENFLREVTKNYEGDAKKNTRIVIGQAANSGFGNGYKGALVWAKHKFDFKNKSMVDRFKSIYEREISKVRRHLNDESADFFAKKISEAKYPYQFVSTGITVSKEQAEQFLGHELDADFNRIFARKGYCDIGELILIQSRISYSAENYINKTSGRAGHLNEKRQRSYEGLKPENRESQRPMPTAESRRSSRSSMAERVASSRSEIPERRVNYLERLLRSWQPPGVRRNMTLTQRRLDFLLSLPAVERAFMFRRMNMTRQARSRYHRAVREAV